MLWGPGLEPTGLLVVRLLRALSPLQPVNTGAMVAAAVTVLMTVASAFRAGSISLDLMMAGVLAWKGCVESTSW